jgi:alginate lyase
VIRITTVQTILFFLLLSACCFILLPKNQLHTIALQFPQQETTPTPQLPRTFLMDPKILYANKLRIQHKDPTIMPAYNNLIKQADKLLTKKPVSVMDKTQIPPSGDKHDYMSLALYEWPDPTKPNGLPYIAKDGEVNPEVNTIPDRNNLNKMISTLATLTLAYYFSNNQKYSDHAILFLKTWFINTDTKMNPNLNYAQGRKGATTGSAGGIIDTTSLPQVLDAIGLLENDYNFKNSDRKQLKNWFNNYLNWLLTSSFGKTERQQSNNHGTWYDVQVSSIALFLDNQQLATQTIQNDMLNRFSKQIDQEGEQPLELARTKSWDYSIFNLQALCDLADIAEKLNINLWKFQTSDGRGILKAVNFLMPYVTGNKIWNYQQIVRLDKEEIVYPLFQAAVGFNKLQYWNTSKEILGKNATTNEYILIYQTPTTF